MDMPPLKHYFPLAKHLMEIVLVLAVTLLGIKETSLQSKYVLISVNEPFLKNFQPKTGGRNSKMTGTLIKVHMSSNGSIYLADSNFLAWCH